MKQKIPAFETSCRKKTGETVKPAGFQFFKRFRNIADRYGRYFEFDIPCDTRFHLLRAMPQSARDDRYACRSVSQRFPLDDFGSQPDAVFSCQGILLSRFCQAEAVCSAGAGAALAESSFCADFIIGEGPVSACFILTVR